MVTLRVNGKEEEGREDQTLMRFLRDDLKVKSVKDGCSEGACGTCTVLIDGEAKKACTQRLKNLEGKKILTVEGLSSKEKEIYVYAFGEAGAVQCGFCIPGMVMCSKALLAKQPDPSRAEAAYAIRGNICRCTGYKKIIDGILLAGKLLRDNAAGENGKIPGMDGAVSPAIGGGFHRIDVREKVLGTGEYVDDIEIEGMVYASAVRSRYPRARVLAIHTQKAKLMPGVLAVLTAGDVPGSNKVGHLKQDWDAFIAVGDITRFAGDSICLVVAETPEILEKAKEAVAVDYEELPPVLSPFEASKEDAPRLHEDGNLLSRQQLVRGSADVDAVIRDSAFKVTKRYETPYTEHAFLEPEAAVAMPFDGGVYIYSSDQGTYDTRKETALLLGLPEGKVIVENKLVGGGFGGKEDVTVQHLAALAAYHTGRVVKAKLTRQESILIHPKRHPMWMEFTTACDRQGNLTALKAKIIADTGAYASLGKPVLQRACTHAAGPYHYQTIDIDGQAYYTNNPPAGAFRGFGVTQTCFASECNLNLLAEQVGISPWEIRWRNAIRPGETLPNGQIAGPETGLAETLEAVKEIYESSPHVGIACAMKNAGIGVGAPDFGRVRLLLRDRKIEIHSGASCIGQGLGTVLVQIVCSITGLSMDQVVYRAADTKTSPDSGTTSGSRQTLVTGEAARRASLDLKKLLDAGKTLEDIPDGTEFYGEYEAKTDHMGADVSNPVSHVAYGYATQVCILDDKGVVERIVAAHDVGKAINPKSVEGQIEGGVVMSLGFALTEQYPLDRGVPKVKFGTLGLFRADKTPEVTSIIVEKPGLSVACGAIGIGEITSIPTAPAVQGAYYRYTGEFETKLPLRHTPYARKR